jgi:hypothetical protein
MYKVLFVCIVVFASIAGFQSIVHSVSATHNTTECKWPFPWPSDVYYWIDTGSNPDWQFT